MTPAIHTSIWQPPAGNLVLCDGLWCARNRSAISYPQEANDAFLAIEDTSFWFRHRLDCLTAVIERFPPNGDFYDIGGGNGMIAAGLARRGWPTILVEPGHGALNARQRGVSRIVQATLADAAFRPGSMPAAGAFDVIEHIADDLGFLRSLRQSLQRDARFYCTVPAQPGLWSTEDVTAGHFRRYTEHSLARVVRAAGFELEFISPVFSWLVLPIFLLRALPSRLPWRRPDTARAHWDKNSTSDHRLPAILLPLVTRIHNWERHSLAQGRPLPTGASLLCVARNRSP